MSGDTPQGGGAVKEAASRPQDGNGRVAIGTVEEILARAPSDLVEDTIEVPEWGCSVKLRSFSAGVTAEIKQRGLMFKGDDTTVAWAEMEIIQFQRGVIEPKFAEGQVRKLHATSGHGFRRVIDWLDKHSGTDKEALRDAQDEFPGAANGASA